MGQSGVQGLAALSVMTPIESISLAMLIGMANASAVLIGNQIGAKKYDEAYYQAVGILFLSVLVALVVAILLFISRDLVLDSFSALSPDTRALTDKFIVILSLGVVLRCIPMMAIVGVLRAGGDVKFCLYQDVFAQWMISIPLCAVAAIYWNWPPESIYVLFLTEELVKWGGSIYRVKSKKWLKNLIEN